MNKFLKDLENELLKLKVSSKDINEILEDHKEMIEVAQAEGLSDKEINAKFGDPIKVANELHSDMKEEPKMNREFKSANSCVEYKTEEYNLVKTFKSVLGTIEFEANLISDDLQYSTYDGEDIQVYEKNIEKLDEYEIELNKNVLILKRKKTIKLFRTEIKAGEFLILIPSGIDHKKIEFNNVSGDANLNDITTEKMIFKSTNGDVRFTNINAVDSKYSFVNGNIEMTNYQGKSMDISVISGELGISEGTFEGDLYFNTVSGDIDLDNVECKSADLRTVSGDLSGNEFYPEEVSLRSVSGDINIHNKDKSRGIRIISKKSISGSIEIN